MAVDLKKSFSEHKKGFAIGGIITVAASVIAAFIPSIIESQYWINKEERENKQQTTVTQAEPDVDLPDNGGDLVDVPGIVTTAPTEMTTTITTTTEMEKPKPVPLMMAYDSNYSYYKHDSVEVAGITYKDVSALLSRDDYYLLYNLRGEYSSLEFDIGHVDGSEPYGGVFGIYLDGDIDQTVSLSASDYPAHVKLNVANINQMKIICEKGDGGGLSFAKYAVINGTLYP